MLVEMRIASLLIDPNTNLPLVVLMELSGRRAVPIVIGLAEAEAIAVALQEIKLPRPRTHDLLRELMRSLGGRLERIVINDLRDSTFFAVLEIYRDGSRIEVDSRPSDAMALACRTGARIFVDEDVLERSRMRFPEEIEEEEEEHAQQGEGAEAAEEKDSESTPVIVLDGDVSSEELKELLEKLDPEDFGKYKM
jgi:bifunctional DNase/RNase